MASSSGTIHAAIMAALAGAGDFFSVEDWPADAETWLSQFRDTGRKLPAMHCAFTSTMETAYTDGSLTEGADYTLTLAFRPEADGFSEYIRLRDLAIAALDADWTFGGLAEISSAVESAMDKQDATVATAKITFKVSHIWTP